MGQIVYQILISSPHYVMFSYLLINNSSFFGFSFIIVKYFEFESFFEVLNIIGRIIRF